MTGKHPFVHGARANAGFVLPEANETLAERLKAAGYRTAAEIAAPVIGRDTKLDQGFDSYRDLDSPDVQRYRVKYSDTPGSQVLELSERVADDITRHGIEFIRSAKDERFFLWLHYFDPHRPYLPHGGPGTSPQDDPYLSEIRYADAHFGRVVAELEQLNLRDRTLVIVVGDHGEGLGEHGEDTHSFLVYDATMHVPLIMWGADAVPRGRRIGSLVRTVDIAPTVADLAGAEPLANIHGVSLAPLLAGDRADLELTGYGESLEPLTMFNCSILRFVREGDWKYIHKVNPELYDVRIDPAELHNVAGEHPEQVAALQARLHDLVSQAASLSESARVDVDERTRVQLQNLGYVGSAPPENLDDEVGSLALEGPDPNDKVADVSFMAEGWEAIRHHNYDAAADSFRAGWKRNPDSLPALEGLIGALMQGGRGEEAIPLLERAMQMGGEAPRHLISLAQLLSKQGRYEEAERYLRRTIEIAPDDPSGYIELAATFAEQHAYDREKAVFEDGLRLFPDSLELLNNYAILLAACPEDSLRDGPRAVELAEKAVALTGGTHPAILGTASLTYAEIGDFERAISTAHKALELMRGRDMQDWQKEISEQLTQYEAGKPVRIK